MLHVSASVERMQFIYYFHISFIICLSVWSTLKFLAKNQNKAREKRFRFHHEACDYSVLASLSSPHQSSHHQLGVRKRTLRRQPSKLFSTRRRKKKSGKKLRLWLCWWRMWNRTFWCSRGKKSLPLQPIAGRYMHLTRRSANRACVVSPQKEILFSKKNRLGKKAATNTNKSFSFSQHRILVFILRGSAGPLACSSFFRNICFECRDGEAGSCGKSLERNTSRSSAVDREKQKVKLISERRKNNMKIERNAFEWFL